VRAAIIGRRGRPTAQHLTESHEKQLKTTKNLVSGQSVKMPAV
jgi:hypothetical protein